MIARPAARAVGALGLAVMVAFGLISCGGSGKKPAAPAPTTGGTDAFSVIGARLEPDGSIGTDLARDLYTALVGPLPGWTVKQPIPSQDLTSGSLAVRGILAHLDALTPAQRDAVQQRLHYLHDAAPPKTPPTPASSTHSLVDLPAVRTRTDDVLQQEIDFAVAALSSRLGRTLSVPITFQRLDDAHYGAGAGERARTTPWSTTEAEPRLLGCEITFRDSIDTLSRRDMREIVAHEVYHCFQNALFPDDIGALGRGPAWIVEGQAAWVGETLAGGGPMSTRWWRHWLTEPSTDLTRRTYDAIGYYSTLDAAAPGLWRALDGMVRDPASAYARTATPAVRQQWATRLVRDASFGADWESVGPGITSDRASIPGLTLSSGASSASASMPSAARSVSLLSLTPAGDAVRLTPGSGVVGAVHAGSGTVTPIDGRPVLLCLRADHCRCPDGSARGGEAYVDAGPGVLTIALQGDSAAQFEASSQSVATTCPSAPPTPTAVAGLDPALVGTWVSDLWTTPPVVGTARGGAGIRITLNADASLAVDFDPMGTVTITNQGVVTQFRYSGSSDGTWSAHDQALRLDYREPHALRVKIAVPTANLNYDEDFASAASGSIGPLTNVEYQVAGGTLKATMTIPHGLGAIVIRFHRAR